MLRIWLLLTVPFSISAFCGVVQGIVVEHASGKALARTNVFLAPVPATAVAAADVRPMTAQSGMSGQFAFNHVPPGLYILTSARDGYFAGAFGQRLPTGRGEPFTVTEEARIFAEIRMRHKGAVTGRVLDENGLGTPRVTVVAYRARLPLRSGGQGISDDRGVYRIAGLEPGKYWVRSAPYALPEGGSWLPAFAPGGHETRDARMFPVAADADTGFADISPLAGFLYTLSGPVTCKHPAEVVVTLSSDTGQQMVRTACTPIQPGGFQFSGLPAGPYELFGGAVDNSLAAFTELTIGGNTKAELSLMDPVTVNVEWLAGSGQRVAEPGTLIVRRQNLAASGTAFAVKERRVSLAPGYWEVRAQAPRGYYVRNVMGVRTVTDTTRRSVPSPDWYELFVRPGWTVSGSVHVVLAQDGATVEGKVMVEGKPAAGVPVWVWPVADNVVRALGGPRQTVSAADGSYRFDDLPPGSYRPLASFDIGDLDDDLIETVNLPALTAKAGQSTKMDLHLWKAPW